MNKLICNHDGLFVAALAIMWIVIYGYVSMVN